jgi:hypothetical protein
MFFGRFAAADPRRRTGARKGFTLLLVLVVALAALAVAAAVITTQAAVAAEQERIARSEAFLLSTLTNGMSIFQGEINGKAPGRLSDLSTAITGTRRSLCGAFYTTSGTPADVDEWSGKYSPRVFPVTGVPIGIGVASDTLEYQIISGSPKAIVNVREVPLQVATRLDARIDTLAGTSGSAAGVVQWGSTDASGLVTLRFAITVNQTCVLNANPAASFTWICAQLTCTFTSTSTDSDGTITSYSWSFGDATTSTLQNPVKTYSTAGARSVSLQVTDNTGGTGSISQTVTARNIAVTVANGGGRGGTRSINISWTGAVGTNVDIYRDGVLLVTTANDGSHTDSASTGATYTYRVCEQGTNICSNNASITI